MAFASGIELVIDTEPETRLWQAVILSAVEDWVSGALRIRREAEYYLFEDKIDFPLVCESAGMDLERLRSRLRKLREQRRSDVPQGNCDILCGPGMIHGQ